MALKPKPQTILNTYSLDELLSLVKEKIEKDAQDQLGGLRTALQSVVGR